MDDNSNKDMGTKNEESLSIASSNTFEEVFLHAKRNLYDIDSTGYLFRKCPHYWMNFHGGKDDEVPWLKNIKFLQKYWTS